MGIDIQRDILGLKGQCVNQIRLDEAQQQLVISCRRDSRRNAIDPVTAQKGTVNRYVRRQVRDVPLFGYPCVIEVELAQVFISKNERRMEHCEFVDKGWRFTRRFCRMISGLCRHMSIQAVSRHLGLRWETVKNIDKAYLEETLPALDPTQLTGLKYLGVDEVARAKGHDYMTVIYDMVEGHLIGVETGRTADVFSAFLKQISAETGRNR
jgi:transposase